MLIKFNFGYDKYQYYNNYLEWHRENGPALEYNNGVKFYCLGDRFYKEKNYWDKIYLKRFGVFV